MRTHLRTVLFVTLTTVTAVCTPIVSAQTAAAPDPTTSPHDPAVGPVVEPAPAPAPTAPAAPAASSGFTFEARPGRGFTVRHGQDYTLTIRPRVQLRNTTTLQNGRNRNEAQVRTLRLWMLGNVINPDIRYGVQLAFGGNDFEAGSSSPVFDAFLDFHPHRDANVKVGQYFVPFDRMRTVRESALQTVDRTVVVQQLTLDRDIGATLYSDDLGGHGGRYAYQVGFFNGEGRNRFVNSRVGFLYTARFTYRPFGPFDDDSEGDLERRASPRLAIGVAGAYNQNASRVRGTTGDPLLAGTTNLVHGAVDVVFKWRGFSMFAEGVVRGSPEQPRPAGTDAMGNPVFQTPSRAIGYVLQASYAPMTKCDFWARWDEIRLPWNHDAQLNTLVGQRGREISAGVNYYLNGHSFKFQLDAVHAFGDVFEDGTTSVRLQLDATF
jgi:hypothetical protein